jgi:hypothetical protein
MYQLLLTALHQAHITQERAKQITGVKILSISSVQGTDDLMMSALLTGTSAELFPCSLTPSLPRSLTCSLNHNSFIHSFIRVWS